MKGNQAVRSKSDIRHAFGHRLVGNNYAKRMVVETLSVFPAEIVDFVTQKVWFIASFDDAWAFTYDGEDFANHHVIFISDELLGQDDAQIKYTLAHEIGHVMLAHRNATKAPQSKEEIVKQEREAHEFSKTYIQDDEEGGVYA